MSRLALITVAGIALAAELSRRGSRAMVDEGMVGNYWGSQGVGTLLTTGQEVFLTLRSAHVLDPEVWGLPGGAVRVDSSTGESDDLYFSASTELQEETGLTLSPEEIRSGTVATTVFRPPRSTHHLRCPCPRQGGLEASAAQLGKHRRWLVHAGRPAEPQTPSRCHVQPPSGVGLHLRQKCPRIWPPQRLVAILHDGVHPSRGYGEPRSPYAPPPPSGLRVLQLLEATPAAIPAPADPRHRSATRSSTRCRDRRNRRPQTGAARGIQLAQLRKRPSPCAWIRGQHGHRQPDSS
jgi:ADP-ribose pyrophosphatase YjhB (NUDIX family)